MKETIMRLMPTLKLIKSLNARTARWKNTRIRLFPEHQFRTEGAKGNLIEFFRLQDTDSPALCVSNKVRTINGRAYTVSHLWLTDEAAIALHRILGESIKDRISEDKTREDGLSPTEFLEYVLEKVDEFPKGLSDREVAEKLNDMDLPVKVWQISFDHYKENNK